MKALIIAAALLAAYSVASHAEEPLPCRSLADYGAAAAQLRDQDVPEGMVMRMLEVNKEAAGMKGNIGRITHEVYSPEGWGDLSAKAVASRVMFLCTGGY